VLGPDDADGPISGAARGVDAQGRQRHRLADDPFLFDPGKMTCAQICDYVNHTTCGAAVVSRSARARQSLKVVIRECVDFATEDAVFPTVVMTTCGRARKEAYKKRTIHRRSETKSSAS